MDSITNRNGRSEPDLKRAEFRVIFDFERDRKALCLWLRDKSKSAEIMPFYTGADLSVLLT